MPFYPTTTVIPVTVYAQITEPTPTGPNDIWIDVVNGNTVKKWLGGWAEVKYDTTTNTLIPNLAPNETVDMTTALSYTKDPRYVAAYEEYMRLPAENESLLDFEKRQRSNWRKMINIHKYYMSLNLARARNETILHRSLR